MTFFCFVVGHYKRKYKVGSGSHDISNATNHHNDTSNHHNVWRRRRKFITIVFISYDDIENPLLFVLTKNLQLFYQPSVFHYKVFRNCFLVFVWFKKYRKTLWSNLKYVKMLNTAEKLFLRKHSICNKHVFLQLSVCHQLLSSN